MDMRYTDGGPRRRLDVVRGTLGHGWAGLSTQGYAEGQAYAECHRRPMPGYADGFTTPRGEPRSWAGRPVRRRPRCLAVGVWHGCRHLVRFL
jgi:hypothetical protein